MLITRQPYKPVIKTSPKFFDSLSRSALKNPQLNENGKIFGYLMRGSVLQGTVLYMLCSARYFSARFDIVGGVHVGRGDEKL